MIITIWLFNIANWKIPYKWRFLAGKIIYFHGPFSMAMLSNQRVTMVDITKVAIVNETRHFQDPKMEVR